MEYTKDYIYKFLAETFPAMIDMIDYDEGIYLILGMFAIYLGKGIENKSIDEPTFKKAIIFLNEMADNNDPEVENLLVVGVFETLSNYNTSMKRIKYCLCPRGIELYEKYCE